MSFDWLGFLDLAKVLAASPAEASDGDSAQREAALRSATSRAYYAAFHHAKSYLQAKDPSLNMARDGRAHDQVPERLRGPGCTRVEKGAAEKLERLRSSRRWADYDRAPRPRLQDNVLSGLASAEAIITNLVIPSQ